MFSGREIFQRLFSALIASLRFMQFVLPLRALQRGGRLWSVWNLEFGASLNVGCWCLDFFAAAYAFQIISATVLPAGMNGNTCSV
jgi:hypothetical protein